MIDDERKRNLWAIFSIFIQIIFDLKTYEHILLTITHLNLIKSLKTKLYLKKSHFLFQILYHSGMVNVDQFR